MIVVLAIAGVLLVGDHRYAMVTDEAGVSKRKYISDLRFDLEVAEDQRLSIAASTVRPVRERRYAYRDAIPAEVERLRTEGLRYRRWRNGFQWLLILCSAAIPAVAALHDPPQPGKGLLVGLGAAVSVITSAMGYYKFRERSFNLQQTADSIAQHLSALDLSITPYGDVDEAQNLIRFAETVDLLRDEQRKREQQLDQPHQAQQGTVQLHAVLRFQCRGTHPDLRSGHLHRQESSTTRRCT
ncbi:SLATT domain-containing protein [Streptomyces sp. WZ.A104]|uniref:SLATT domain-containing protein n=1 Tax=Streptomyces sp. WZ.A104 TaxID=2023771 RepID=UPI001C5492B9|nr:SLATT domain-containing protein [Streptomyces sp. WZ.A104]